MRIGVLEPHLRRYGGIRHMLELSNHLVDRGHQVTVYVPRSESRTCSWMPCRAAVRLVDEGRDDDLDVLVFNDEPQWFLLERFPRARRRVFYALHHGAQYRKRCSWEAVRTDVDLQLANSGWTADMIEAETGHRPVVVLPGIDQELFRPHGAPVRYPILCTGDAEREWKGTETVLEAARLLGLEAEGYAHKDLSQPALALEYCAAETFAVGSWYEGFGLPGLEALACGVPLVTTDNGGCREYAVDGETALVVPPRDAVAMADALGRLRQDRRLAGRLSANGLELVRSEFGWDRRTDRFEEVLAGLVEGPGAAPPPGRPAVPVRPTVSVVVLAWNNLPYTQACVESIRRHTDLEYELIIVDNGSDPEAASYARHAADVAVANPTNLGFATGMNQGLAAASGEYVAFCNNDTELPPHWASQLVETARKHTDAGIVVPALTASGNPDTVRAAPGSAVVALRPFSSPPAAVLYLMPTEVARGVHGWSEDYAIASGEDTDLAFKVWVNDLDIVFDERVLVEHKDKATARLLGDWRSLWDRNRAQFVRTWQRPDLDVPRLDRCEPARHERNRAIAAATAEWMERCFAAQARSNRGRRAVRRLQTRLEGFLRRGWGRVEGGAPAPVARAAGWSRRHLRSWARPGREQGTGHR